VIENLELARLGRAGGGVLATMGGGADLDCFARLREADLLEHFATPVEQLPHGLKQRLEILMLVSRGRKLLLLDEPTAGMTETADTARMIRTISREHGIAVLAIS
jgi:ABC-type uncharacterized transport system ATPase subunit